MLPLTCRTSMSAFTAAFGEIADVPRRSRAAQHGSSSRFYAFGSMHCSIESSPLTIWVMRRSTTRLANDKAWRGEKPCSSPISLTISTVAIAAASSRLRPKPKVSQPLIWRARGNARRSSGWSRNSISTRIGQFSAGPATSPSPCFHLPSFTLDGQRIEQIDYVRLLLVDDFHFVLQPIVAVEEGPQAVLLLGPIGPHLLTGFLQFFLFLLVLFFLPILLTSLVDLVDRICQMHDVIVVATRFEQHFQRLALGIAVLAIPGEDVVLGDDPLKEILVDIIVAAVVRDFEQFDLNFPALLHQSCPLPRFAGLGIH